MHIHCETRGSNINYYNTNIRIETIVLIISKLVFDQNKFEYFIVLIINFFYIYRFTSPRTGERGIHEGRWGSQGDSRVEAEVQGRAISSLVEKRNERRQENIPRHE